MPKWEPAPDRGLLALSDPRLSNPSQDQKEVLLWSRRRTWVNIAVRPCLHSFHTHNKHHLFENKVWEIYIFIKKCIRSLLKSFITGWLFSAYIFICIRAIVLWLYNSKILGTILEMDPRRTKTNGPAKKLTMHHPGHDVDRQYVSRKGGRGLANIEDSDEVLIQQLEKFIEMRGGRYQKQSGLHEDLQNGNNLKTKMGRKTNLWTFLKRLTNDISHKKTWTGLRKGNFMRETESLLIAAQNNVLRPIIWKEEELIKQKSRSRLCGNRDETINHIISECSKLAQKEYMTKHDRVGKVIY